MGQGALEQLEVARFLAKPVADESGEIGAHCAAR